MQQHYGWHSQSAVLQVDAYSVESYNVHCVVCKCFVVSRSVKEETTHFSMV